ncbi:MAG: DNA polymerase III subunit beta [Bacteroidetes bacterium]|nr:DNA polymerase III subunit beta [Bacteroidota bacterium]
MKIECSIEKLKEAVGKAEKITGKTSTLESLKSIFLIASGKSLKIRSTNLSLGLEIEFPVKVEEEGEVIVSGEILNNTIINFGNTEKTVFLEKKNENISISSKKSKVLIKSLVSDDFPIIPTVEGKNFNIDVEKFIEGIKSVFYSSAINDIKPEISSVYIYNQEENIFFVSTDSFRLAEKNIKVKSITELDGLIIPYKNVLEIIKLLSDIKGEMNVNYTKNQISFVLPGFYLTSRLIDGTFPDYRQIVPKSYKTKAIILKKDLLDAIKLSNIFSDKFNQVKISVKPKEKNIEVYAINKEIGENNTKIDGALEGDDIEMSFNYKYILDCFQSINEDSIVLEFNETNKPVIIKGNGDKNFLYLIMPMNR